MTNEQIKEKVKEIKKLADDNRLEKAADAAMEMSKCSDLFAIQMFLRGLSKNLEFESNTMLSIWSKAYDITKEEQKEEPHAE